MNSLFVLLGIESWKPMLTALLLPPVPFIVLVLLGVRVMAVRRAWGWLMLVVAFAGLWLAGCSGMARWLEPALLHVPPALSEQRMAALRAEAKARPGSAIVVLGGGVEPFAPEYGTSNLTHYSMERLRYGLWLARETGLPVAFSGGVGWASRQSAPEADTAARIASQEFRQPMRWTENQSRDTRENAAYSMAMLKRSGISHVVLVTHGWHMPRALRHFEEAGRANGISVEPAPMGLAERLEAPALDWMPSERGQVRMRQVLREWLGRLLGA